MRISGCGADWLGLPTLVCQQTTRWVAGKVQEATRYFLFFAGRGERGRAGSKLKSTVLVV